MAIKLTKKGKVDWSKTWATVSCSGFKNAIVPLSTMDHITWNFMKKAGIKSMNVLMNKCNKTITIETDSVNWECE